jgi:hypothetical protein
MIVIANENDSIMMILPVTSPKKNSAGGCIFGTGLNYSQVLLK